MVDDWYVLLLPVIRWPSTRCFNTYTSFVPQIFKYITKNILLKLIFYYDGYDPKTKLYLVLHDGSKE